LKCTDTVNVEVVQSLSEHLLSGIKVDTALFENVNVFSGKIVRSKTNGGSSFSEIRYVRSGRKDATTFEILVSIYHSLWNFLYSDYDEKNLDFDSYPDSSTIEELKTVMELLEKLHHMTDVGVRYSELLLKEIKNKDLVLETVQHLGNKIAQVDDNIDKLGKVSAVLKPLIDLMKVEKESLEESDLEILTINTREIYMMLALSVQYVYQLVHQVVESASVVSDRGQSHTTKKEVDL
jgi:hypothetical protein